MRKILIALALVACAATAQAATRVEAPIVLAQAAPGPAASQTTIQTTAPVDSTTRISVGTLAGEVLTWLAAAFSLPVGTLLALWLSKLGKLAGVQVTQQMSDRLNSIIVNGLNDAAARATTRLQGRGQVEIKNAVVADAVVYTQKHAAETIQALGLDPQSGAAVEAIKARIETAIADPTTPTAPVLAGPSAPAPRPV